MFIQIAKIIQMPVRNLLKKYKYGKNSWNLLISGVIFKQPKKKSNSKYKKIPLDCDIDKGEHAIFFRISV